MAHARGPDAIGSCSNRSVLLDGLRGQIMRPFYIHRRMRIYLDRLQEPLRQRFARALDRKRNIALTRTLAFRPAHRNWMQIRGQTLPWLPRMTLAPDDDGSDQRRLDLSIGPIRCNASGSGRSKNTPWHND